MRTELAGDSRKWLWQGARLVASARRRCVRSYRDRKAATGIDVQHGARDAAEQKLAQPGMAVGAEHQKVGAGGGEPVADDVVDRPARPTLRVTETLRAMPGERGGDVGAGLDVVRAVSGGSMTRISVLSASMMKGRASKAARAASRLPFQATSTWRNVARHGPVMRHDSTGRPAS